MGNKLVVTGLIVAGATILIGFQNCGQGFEPKVAESQIPATSLPNPTPNPAPIPTPSPMPAPSPTPSVPPVYDSAGCPIHLKPGANTNSMPNRIVDLNRVRINFGMMGPLNYSCRTDSVAPYKIDPPVRTGLDYANFLTPLRDHLFRLATITSTYVRYQSNALPAAQCALDWIMPWANARIFTERAGVASEGGDYLTRQGDFERVFHFASFAIAYAAIKDEPGLDPTKKRRIEDWLLLVGNEINRFSTIRIRNDVDATNNILNWSAFALMSIGLTINNQTLIDRSIVLYDIGLDQIRADGLLPLELARGAKSFWYHNYALQPLVYMAEMSRPFGKDLYGRKNNRLQLLIERMISSFANFQSFPNFQTQDAESNPTYFLTDNSRELSWIEIHYSRAGDARLKPLLTRARATYSGTLKYSFRTAGSSTHFFGAKCL